MNMKFFVMFIAVLIAMSFFVSAKTFHIDDTFKVGWSDGADNYEAEYKVWKIEEQNGVNITILIHASTGSIAMHSLSGLTQSLGANAKLIIDQIYVSGDDNWISITLENAVFKESTLPSSPSSGSGGGGGGAVPISNSSSGGGGSGGSNSSSSCVRYYTCPDGTQVNYCSITSNGNGGGCGCLSNPSSLCSSPSNSSNGGSGEGRTNSPSNGSSGASNGSMANSPSNGSSVGSGGVALCSTGCNYNGSCVSVGFRVNNTYCDLNKIFPEQKEAGLTCENNFECSTNLCIDNQCVSSNVWQKFVKWISRLFGGN